MERGNANSTECAEHIGVGAPKVRQLLDHEWFVKSGNGRATTYRNAKSQGE